MPDSFWLFPALSRCVSSNPFLIPCSFSYPHPCSYSRSLPYSVFEFQKGGFSKTKKGAFYFVVLSPTASSVSFSFSLSLSFSFSFSFSFSLYVAKRHIFCVSSFISRHSLFTYSISTEWVYLKNKQKKEAAPCVTSTQDSRKRDKYSYYRFRHLLYHIWCNSSISPSKCTLGTVESAC